MAFGARKYIGAAEYWRRGLLGKYSPPPKVAFIARKYGGAAESLRSDDETVWESIKAAMGTVKNIQHYRRLF